MGTGPPETDARIYKAAAGTGLVSFNNAEPPFRTAFGPANCFFIFRMVS